MKQQLQRLALLGLSLLAIPALATAPVYARQGSDDSTSTSNTTSTEVENETEDETEHLTNAEVKNRVEAYKKQAEQRIKELEAKKEAAKKKSEEERKKSCESRLANLNARVTKKSADAEKHMGVFTKIYTRVTDFYTTKNLKVTNYAELTAKVDVAQTNAEKAIQTLKSTTIPADCSDVNAVTTQIATYQSALKDAREALKVYRTSIKDLIVAVKSSIEDDTTSTSSDDAANNSSTSNNSSATGSGN